MQIPQVIHLDEEHLPYGISRNEVTELDIAFPRGLFSLCCSTSSQNNKTTLDGDLIEVHITLKDRH